jgi:hypothetical protein
MNDAGLLLKNESFHTSRTCNKSREVQSRSEVKEFKEMRK